MFFARSSAAGPRSQASDAEFFRSKARLFFARFGCGGSGRASAAVDDFARRSLGGSPGIVSNSLDDFRANVSGSLQSPAHTRDRSDVSGGDNPCDDGVGTLVGYRQPDRVETWMAERLACNNNSDEVSNGLLRGPDDLLKSIKSLQEDLETDVEYLPRLRPWQLAPPPLTAAGSCLLGSFDGPETGWRHGVRLHAGNGPVGRRP